jgi:hypothetical protein
MLWRLDLLVFRCSEDKLQPMIVKEENRIYRKTDENIKYTFDLRLSLCFLEES